MMLFSFCKQSLSFLTYFYYFFAGFSAFRYLSSRFSRIQNSQILKSFSMTFFELFKAQKLIICSKKFILFFCTCPSVSSQLRYEYNTIEYHVEMSQIQGIIKSSISTQFGLASIYMQAFCCRSDILEMEILMALAHYSKGNQAKLTGE